MSQARRIAVADNRAWNLRIFAATGEHLHTFGGRGEGPGEFTNPRILGTLPGDTLVVVDSRLRRINLFHPDEGFVRSATAGSGILGRNTDDLGIQYLHVHSLTRPS